MNTIYRKICLSLIVALVVGCGTSKFISAAQAQGPLQDLDAPAHSVPVERFAQIDLRVPAAPTFIPSGGSQYLTHELIVENQIPLDYQLLRVEVIDADTNQIVDTLSGTALRQRVRLTGLPALDEESLEPVPLGPGQSAIVFFFIEFTNTVPQNLTHRIVVRDANGDDLTINHDLIVAVDATPPTVLAPPLAGGPFLCDGAPGFDSYHRRTMLVIDGLSRISQRYAIDFEILTPQGTTFIGNPAVNDNYPIYGQPLLAAASGTVVKVVDGLPDNTPPEVPVLTDVDNAGGNAVVIDIGNGRYLVYGHMQPGSITVDEGDTVTVGQQLGLAGNSGNSFEPHLHIQVCDRPSFLGAQGLPYVFNNYTLVEGATQTPIQNQIPLLNQVINFPGTVSHTKMPEHILARSHPKCGWY